MLTCAGLCCAALLGAQMMHCRLAQVHAYALHAHTTPTCAPAAGAEGPLDGPFGSLWSDRAQAEGGLLVYIEVGAGQCVASSMLGEAAVRGTACRPARRSAAPTQPAIPTTHLPLPSAP